MTKKFYNGKDKLFMQIQNAVLSNVKPRNQRIDAIKFLLILSIFIFHLQNAAGGLYAFCGTYQVEAFFAVSGFWALKKIDKPCRNTICSSLKRYLIPWFIWVVIYTVYYSISGSYGIGDTTDLFVRYFSAIRGTGISGMWFTPLFFFISIFYTLLAKLIARISKFSDKTISLILFVFSFAVWFVTRYYIPLPKGLLFSLRNLPKFLFYFSSGTLLYNSTDIFNTNSQSPRCGKVLCSILYLVSSAYMAAVYFKKDKLIWGWTAETLNGNLSFLPEVLTVFFALCALNFIAKYISCDFVSKIGGNTLGLCHGEALLKSLLVFAASLVGLNLEPASPIEAVIFALTALLFGSYILLPIVDKLTARLFNNNKTNLP